MLLFHSGGVKNRVENIGDFLCKLNKNKKISYFLPIVRFVSFGKGKFDLHITQIKHIFAINTQFCDNFIYYCKSTCFAPRENKANIYLH